MFAGLLEFTKPSGISFTLCVHIINNLLLLIINSYSTAFFSVQEICATFMFESNVCMFVFVVQVYQERDNHSLQTL